jgi:hypothetical protein
MMAKHNTRNLVKFPETSKTALFLRVDFMGRPAILSQDKRLPFERRSTWVHDIEMGI